MSVIVSEFGQRAGDRANEDQRQRDQNEQRHQQGKNQPVLTAEKVPLPLRPLRHSFPAKFSGFQ
jgi:hypothetical protein